MLLHFLKAAVPLTKSFEIDAAGTLQKNSYPHVHDFHSIDHPVKDIKEFYEAVKFHASENHCLLKGTLHKQLSGESRAGSTNPLDTTNWVVFDLDDIRGIVTPSQFVEMLPGEFQNVSYIVQYSASYNMVPAAGMRCHIFFLLENDVAPDLIKNWLTWFNLESDILNGQLRLSANAMSMCFPLDRTVAQNDKLIYIAPPLCGAGIDDPMADRIALVEKDIGKSVFTFATDTVGIDERLQLKITQLRHGMNLRKKLPKFERRGDFQVLTNPDSSVVTGEKEQNGFIRVNVGGGDSWAYYYKPGSPYLHNFKGEPSVKIADFLPAYHEQISGRPVPKRKKGTEAIVIRDIETATYFNGVFNHEQHEFVFLSKTKSKDMMNDFCRCNHTEMPDPIPDYDMRFEPANDVVFDPNEKFINTFQRSHYLRHDGGCGYIPPTIAKLLDSVCVDEITKDYLINWLAVIIQKRRKLGTAWIFSGVQGTGKGLLINNVLAPILGRDYVVTKHLDDLNDRFNAELEQCLILNIDESSISGAVQAKKLTGQLKNMITEPFLGIRKMHANSRQLPSHVNLMITSNEFDAMIIDPSDRRYNVAPRQETPIDISLEEIEAIEEELPRFSSYLRNYEINEEHAKKALNSNAKEQMRQAAMSNIEPIVLAISKGDLETLAYMIGGPIMGDDVQSHEACKETIDRCLVDAIAGRSTHITKEEVYSMNAYYSASKVRQGKGKFIKMMLHRGIDFKDGPLIVDWKTDPFVAQNIRKETKKAQ